MKFGICGYGNVGRAAERQILDFGDDEIVGIFSRRTGVKSACGVNVFRYEEAKDFEGKIDVMLMCGGSQEDLLLQTPEMLKYFDVIDTFDTHAKIKLHKNNLQKVAKENGHVAMFSCGWDPGLFSLVRTLSSNLFGFQPQTFWGEGVSQGHSEALRNIDGIADAIQFTVPNEEILQKVSQNPTYVPAENDKHERHCFIALDGTRDEKEIIEEINQTENYFKGQKVKVEVCSLEEIEKLKERMHHKGSVFGGDKTSKMSFHVEMESNPDFTAKIMLAYSRALPKLQPGAYSVLDIPVGLIGKEDNGRHL